MSTLESIIRAGNRERRRPQGANVIRCQDGFEISVIAGYGTYCSPRLAIDDAPPWGPFKEVECGYPSERPEPWDQWSWYAEVSNDPTGTVYRYVPVSLVRLLVEIHGGER